MKVGILGSGIVAQTLGAGFLKHGHEVTLGTRETSKLAEWAKQNPELAVKAVTARCARVSYLTHDTGKLDLNADYRLADSLGENGHRSPFEHAGEPFGAAEWSLREDGIAALVNSPYATQVPDYVLKQTTKSLEFAGNFRGWGQARRRLPSEDVFQPQQETAA